MLEQQHEQLVGALVINELRVVCIEEDVGKVHGKCQVTTCMCEKM